MISYEEYYPYGASAYRASRSSQDLSLKRYRFTGKERDEETGLDYFGVRYYASWLGRWTSADPGGFVDGFNMYRYTRNNPVNGIDREGYSTEAVEKPKPPPVEEEKPKQEGLAMDNSLDAQQDILLNDVLALNYEYNSVSFQQIDPPEEGLEMPDREIHGEQFANDYLRDLSLIYKYEFGKALIRSLPQPGVLIRVRDSGSAFSSDDGDVRSSETKGDYPNYWEAKKGVVTVYYAQRDHRNVEPFGGTTPFSFIVLAHEFIHARDIASGYITQTRERLKEMVKNGFEYPAEEVPNEFYEVRAMIYTNIIRQEHELGEVRTTYRGVRLLEEDGITPIKDYGIDPREDLFIGIKSPFNK